ncbi:MAG: type II secretion system protein [Proteobacteria bacterium]|nr:type II secretion system protein [Pseudomonadota bacterium]
MRRNQGFTLLEMALVVTIIGLLIAAIFVGQSLIRAANLQNMMQQSAKYSAAFTDFRNKYNALPGDMPTAQSFWGAPAGGCPEGTGIPGQVCNGNGDGNIYNFNNAANIAELRSQWIELANSKFIEGSFTYLPATGGSFQVGVNTPNSAVSDGMYMIVWGPSPIFGAALYNTVAPYAVHWLYFGRLVANTGVLRPILGGQEAMALDRKSDDGKPGTGKIRGSRNDTTYGYTPNCQTMIDAENAQYNQATTDEVCMMMFSLSQ